MNGSARHALCRSVHLHGAHLTLRQSFQVLAGWPGGHAGCKPSGRGRHVRTALLAMLLNLPAGFAGAQESPSPALVELRAGLEAYLIVEPRAAELPQSAADAARQALATRAFGRQGREARGGNAGQARGADVARGLDALPGQAAQAARGMGAARSEAAAGANAEARAAAGQAAAQRGRDRAQANPGTGGRPSGTPGAMPGRGGRP